MSSARNSNTSSSESRKKAGNKTKHGRPAGRREVVEKYKAIGVENLDCRNYKQYGIRARVFGFSRYANSLAPSLTKENRHAYKHALGVEILADEDEAYQECAEHKAHEEACRLAQKENEMARQKDEEDLLKFCELFGRPAWDWYEENIPGLEGSIEGIDWFEYGVGFLEERFTHEFFDNLEEIMAEVKDGKRSPPSLGLWYFLAAPHAGGKNCFICLKMLKYGIHGVCL